MNAKQNMHPENPAPAHADLELAFDAGHSSIGWAVLNTQCEGASKNQIRLPGVKEAGVLLFPSDDCLASVRRQLRGQRRHARATRKRIQSLAKLLLRLLANSTEVDAQTLYAHLKTYLDANPVNRAKLQGQGHPAPWLLAARVLRGGNALSWPQFWDVLRWYAHNRGYDDQVPWARSSGESLSEQAQQEQEKDRKRQAKAIALMKKYGQQTMAETVFCYMFDEKESGRYELDPNQVESLPFFRRYFKQQECIFPRETVQDEVKTILEAHHALLEKSGIEPDNFITGLLENWTALPAEVRGGPRDKDRLWLPQRYGILKKRQLSTGQIVEERTHAGLLFGQLIPRFENRIVSICPFMFARLYNQFLTTGLAATEYGRLPKSWKNRLKPEEPLAEETARHLARIRSKVPSKASDEFLQFRWAMLLADLTVRTKSGGVARALNTEERNRLNDVMKDRGTLTVDELHQLICDAAPSHEPGNLEDIFAETPERAKELYVDRVLFAATTEPAKHLLPLLPDRLRKRILNQLRRGQSLKVSDLQAMLKQFGYANEASAFAEKIVWLQDAENLKSSGGKGKRPIKGKAKPKKIKSPILDQVLRVNPLQGRARFHREILKQAVVEILAGLDPRKKAFDPKNPDEKAERKNKDGCLVETSAMRSLALGHGIGDGNTETAFQSWLEGWRKKRNRKGQLANEALYQKHGEPFARSVYDARASDQWLAEQTNNHLVRQRLLLMRRLTEDIIKEFANGQPERIAGVTIEVARDLLAFSGMQKKDIGSDTKGALKSLKAQHYRVSAKLEKVLGTAGKKYLIDGKLIWKAKVADDLGWKCPYTQEPICPLDLALGRMDVDHIIPRSKHLTDSMGACVITFKEINQKKKNLTAYQFVERFQGQYIGGMTKPIKPRAEYLKFVGDLKTCRPSKAKTPVNGEAPVEEAPADEETGAMDLNPKYLPGTDRLHPDYLRRRKRKMLLKVKSSDDEDLGFTERDLTVTSHLNRLAQSTLLRALPHLRPEDFTSLPGVVTGSVRDMGGWQLLGVLGDERVCGASMTRTVKQIDHDTKLIKCDPKTGKELEKTIPKPKNDIRKLTHLHHALDACTLGILAQALPKDGKLWEYIAVGELTDAQAADFWKRSDEFRWRGHPFSRLFTLLPIPADQQDAELKQPRTHRVVSVWSKENKALMKEVKEGLIEALRWKRVRFHIPAERTGMPTNQTVYRVLTSLEGPGQIPKLAREIVAAKERQLKQIEDALATEQNKERRKKSIVQRDALQKLLGKLKDFENNVWLVNRVRVESESGKKILKRIGEYRDWLQIQQEPQLSETENEIEDETEAEDETEEADEVAKKKRKPREPNLLRPFDAKAHKLLFLYNVVSRAGIVGLPPADKIAEANLLPLKAAKELGANYAAAILPPVEIDGAKRWRDNKEILVLPFFQVHRTLEELRAAHPGKAIELLRNGAIIHVPKGERVGWWRVVSVKDTESRGIALDLATVDGVKKSKGNAPVADLLVDGMRICKSTLCGVAQKAVPCPTTSSA